MMATRLTWLVKGPYSALSSQAAVVIPEEERYDKHHTAALDMTVASLLSLQTRNTGSSRDELRIHVVLPGLLPKISRPLSFA